MANTFARDKARALRAGGGSFNEIAHRLNVPKSTVRFWCRDIVLSAAQRRRLYERQRRGGIRAAEQIRKNRIFITKQLLKEGAQEIGKLSKRDLLMVGAALYWAEGYRKGDGEFGFTNSDPRMIRFTIRWLEKICGVGRQNMHFRVCINAIYEPRIKEVLAFWAKITNFPVRQFSKPTFIKSVNKKVYINSSAYFGTLRIKVRRSTNLKRKIMGWIKGLADQV